MRVDVQFEVTCTKLVAELFCPNSPPTDIIGKLAVYFNRRKIEIFMQNSQLNIIQPLCQEALSGLKRGGKNKNK